MIHQLICEGQVCDRSVVVVTLRTVDTSGRYPVSTVTTAYYEVDSVLAQRLVKTDVFYSGDDCDQISRILAGQIPDIIRRRTQTGRIGLRPTPEELENDLRAVFSKNGGPMPVYRFVCDQAEGCVITDGARQVMRGVWSGKSLAQSRVPTAREMANSLPDAEGVLDMELPDCDNPDICVVFSEEPASEDSATRAFKKDVDTALAAMFPDAPMSTRCYREGGRTVLALDVCGDVDSSVLEFMAELGCCDPEIQRGTKGSTVYFYFDRPISAPRLCESRSDPAVVVLQVPGESDRKLWVGCAMEMQDLSRFDCGTATRVFAAGRYSGAMDADRACRVVKEGVDIVLGGHMFNVKSVSVRGGAIVAEARRVIGPRQSVCDFPARLVERLRGKCVLPRRDELMFESWAAKSGFKMGSAKVLGDEYWCDEPAFGGPCECVRVLISKRK